MVWDGVREVVARSSPPAQPVRVIGRYVVHPRYGAQVNLRALRPAEPGTYELDDLLDGPARDADQMEADLRELIATIQQPHLRALLERLIGTRAARWPAFRDAPAAKFYHQAYRHGLLEHSLTVGQAVSAISATFAGHRPRRRGHRRAAARHRQARRLHRRPGEHRPHRRRAPAGRDRARLLPRAARDRGDRRLPAGARRGAAAHHPRPPRHARARQPGRCRRRARRRSCTWSTTSAAGSAASTASRRSCATASAGRASTARSAAAPSSPASEPLEPEARRGLGRRATVTRSDRSRATSAKRAAGRRSR